MRQSQLSLLTLIIKDYIKSGGYSLLKECLDNKKKPMDLIEEMEKSGLRVLRSWFSNWKKWRFVRAESQPRLMAINGDEGEPALLKIIII